MKKALLVFVFFLFSALSFAQISYDGPADGSVETGVTVSTDNFSKSLSTQPRIKLFYVNDDYDLPDYLQDPTRPTGYEGSNVVRFKNSLQKSTTDSVIVFKGYEGFTQENSIPPDPYIAVGPNYVMQVVNSRFMIADKEGNILKDISANSWFGTALQGASTFDPKVIYDHFDNRWVMVWLHQNGSASESYYLISVSDDDNPLGTWFNWALPSNVNGNTSSGNWGDYEGIGFDDKAIYLTSNQFSFAGSYAYTKIRIIDKFSIYISSDPGMVTWKDIWNITYPGSGYSCFGIRPVRMQTVSNNYYFAVGSPYSTGTSVGVFTLSSPISNPRLAGVAVPVTSYTSPPDPNQLGGGSPRIDGGGKNLRNEPVYKDGYLYMVHAVRDGSYSGVNFLQIDVSSMTADQDIVFGDGEHYHTYPAIALDGEDNSFVTYSRSANDEYMGAYFSVISPGAIFTTEDKMLQPGQDNYVVTYGGSRNRWGDYNGAWTDPSDNNNIWFCTEFVHAKNSWGVWNSGVRAHPYQNATMNVSASKLDFGQIEVGSESEELDIYITNWGREALEINNIAITNPDFVMLDQFSPTSLNAFDSLTLRIKFIPTIDTVFADTLWITNSSNVPNVYVVLNGEGYIIQQVYKDKMYASSGRASGGALATVNLATGEAVSVGNSGYKPLRTITINPLTNQIFAIAGTSQDSSLIVRVSSADGNAFPVHFTGYPGPRYNVPMDAMAFDKDGVLYGVSTEPKLYTINVQTGDETYIADLPMRFAAVTFNPTTNEMYAASRLISNKDLIMTVNIVTGDTTHVGKTGLNNVLWGLAFDSNGNLFGVQGTEYQTSKLIAIDVSTGAGTEVGTTGIKGLLGLAFAYDGLVGVDNDVAPLPTKFALNQNYPNPFNPTTVISYSIAGSANVTLRVYNSLGQQVATLVDGVKSAGSYRVTFDASKLASGVYIYTIKAGEFVASKKMVLIR